MRLVIFGSEQALSTICQFASQPLQDSVIDADLQGAVNSNYHLVILSRTLYQMVICHRWPI